MTTGAQHKLQQALNGIYLACVLAFAGAVAHNHYQLISHPYPLDYNEAGMLVVTDTIAGGDNPYALASQPTRISIYPVLYNVVVAPFTRVFGNSLELHRLIAGVCILLCAALCYAVCRRESGTRIDSLAAAVAVYAGLLFYSTPIASPTAMGLLLFLGALAVPMFRGYSTPSLAVAIVLGILAFHTKQYFIACLGYIALFLFLAVSKQRAIGFGVITAIAFLAVLALVCLTSPYYLEDTFFAVSSAARYTSTDAIVLIQLREYAVILLPALLILAVVLARQCLRYLQPGSLAPGLARAERPVNLVNFDRPLLARAASSGCAAPARWWFSYWCLARTAGTTCPTCSNWYPRSCWWGYSRHCVRCRPGNGRSGSWWC